MNEVSLVRKAIKDDWPVTSQHRFAAVKLIGEVLSDEELGLKMKLMAVRTLGILDSINVKREENEIRKAPKHIIHHKDLTTEQLTAKIVELLPEVGIDDIPQAMLESLDSQLSKGKIKIGEEETDD